MVSLTDRPILQVLAQVLQPQLGLRQLGVLLGHSGPQSLDLLVCCLQGLLHLQVGLLDVAGRHLCSKHTGHESGAAGPTCCTKSSRLTLDY